MITVDRDSQRSNAQSPMILTELPMVTEVREVQKENAEDPMDMTESGMITEVREVQSWNAQSSMNLTESGMVTEVREVHPENAEGPMVNTLSPTTMDLIDELYEAQGITEEVKSVIAPIPLIVSTPVSSSNVHVRLSPQVPL